MSNFKSNGRIAAAIVGALAIGATVLSTPAAAAPLPIFPFFLPPPMEAAPPPVVVVPQDDDQAFELPARLRRQVVNYSTREAPGTIIIDTPNTYLYLVLGNGQAMRYGIGIGRDGFTWSGRGVIQYKKEWPTWTPPSEMIDRQPELEPYRHGMPPSLENPLGARALYIFKDGRDTIYRLHGATDERTIGKAISSGCVRLLNQDVIDLYQRMPSGSPIMVM